jgi:hypothetical protein
VLERRRETVAPGGERSSVQDEIRLDRLSIRELQREAVSAGLTAAGIRRIDRTLDHVASEVVLFRG